MGWDNIEGHPDYYRVKIKKAEEQMVNAPDSKTRDKYRKIAMVYRALLRELDLKNELG